MVDVGEKDNSSRQAIARGEIQMSGETLSPVSYTHLPLPTILLV